METGKEKGKGSILQMIVIDKNNRHIGIFDESWIKNKHGKRIGDNIFQLSYPWASFRRNDYIVRVRLINGEYNIKIRNGVFTTNIKTKSQDEMKSIVKALDARCVIMDENNHDYNKNKKIENEEICPVINTPIEDEKYVPYIPEEPEFDRPVMAKSSDNAETIMPIIKAEVNKPHVTEIFFDDQEVNIEHANEINTDSAIFDAENNDLAAEESSDSKDMKEPENAVLAGSNKEDFIGGQQNTKKSFNPHPFFYSYIAGNSFLNNYKNNTVDKKESECPSENKKTNGIPVPVPIKNASWNNSFNAINNSEKSVENAESVISIPSGAEEKIIECSQDSIGIVEEIKEENVTEKYRYKFYLDANHYISFDGQKGAIHPHTWEIAIEIKNRAKGKIVKFSVLEAIIKEILQPYQMNCLNDIPPFDKMNPVTENIGHYFKEQIQNRISNDGWILTELIISESANRSYII